MTEAEIIAALVRPQSPTGSAFRPAVGIGDDGAVLRDGTVLTMDTMVEGRHWDEKLTPADVGWKLAAVNASDLGSMGARPQWALLSLALPDPLDTAWLLAFRDGLHEGLDHFGLTLVGGDTVSAPVRTLTLAVGGRAARPVLRSTGRQDDDVYVTGQLGFAAEGFLSLAPSALARAALARPHPPVELGIALAEQGLATSMMDLSDGLRADLERLCVASGVSAEIDPATVPGVADLAWRVAFGEDYQLLFTADKSSRSAVESLSATRGVLITRIGTLTAPLFEQRSLAQRTGTFQPRLIGMNWPDPLFNHFPRS